MKIFRIRYGLLLAMAIIAQTLGAALRQEDEARALALAYMGKSKGNHDIILKSESFHSSATRGNEASPSFYIFNNECEDGGFVIIAASDHIRPVLGYSEQGHLTAQELPDNLQNWLNWIEQATIYLEQHPEAALSEASTNSSVTTPIAPLLQNIAWSQITPFNELCPNRYPAGCVATALAQVIYYYRYPQHGKGGTLSYTSTSGLRQTLDFSTQSYNYALMFDRYDEQKAYSQAQLQEVAQLSYHCGLLSHMDYRKDESGASEFFIPYTMNTYMGYDAKAQCLERAVYTYEEWNTLMLTELNARRPVIYCGSSSKGGHCFILDGINSDGLYHVNWGWAGQGNGYYNISILKPSIFGVGTSDANDGFVTNQSAIVQLAPTVNEGRYYSPIQGMNGQLNSLTSSANAGEKSYISMSALYNLSPLSTTGSYGVAFLKDGQIIHKSPLTLGSGRPAPTTATIEGAEDRYVKGIVLKNCFFTTPKLANGNYQMFAYFQPSTGVFKDSISFIHFSADAPSYLNVTVNGGRMTFSKDQFTPNLTATDWNYEQEEIVAGRQATITCAVTNQNTSSTWAGKLYLYCTRVDGTALYVEADDTYSIGPGETIEATFTHAFMKMGAWKSALYAQQTSISDTKTAIAHTSQSFSVLDDGTGSAALSLTSSPFIIGFADLDTPATFGIPVLNYGKDYHGRFAIQIYQTSPSSPLLTLEGEADIPGGIRDTIYVSGTITDLSKNRTYYGSAYYLRQGEYTLITGSGITNRLKINVYAEGTHTNSIPAVGLDRKNDHIIHSIDGHHIAPSATDSISLPEGFYIIEGKKIKVGK